MKQKAIKLVLSGAATLALAVSLTATTFAYVLIGNNVTVEEFDFKVDGQEGLLISLDGVNFSQDIAAKDLKKFISGSVEEFDKNSIIGTTVSEEAGLAVYNNTELLFEKERINYIASTDSYERTFVGAIPNKDYITFDLYFKAENTKTAITNYNLSFGEQTYVSANTEDVELYNSFKTYEFNSSTGKYETKTHLVGTKVKQNVANAMRLAIYNEELADPLSVYEVTDENDMGSAAINGYTDKKHDPYSSMMINYYNVMFPLYPFSGVNDDKVDENDKKLEGVIGANDCEAFRTIPNYGEKDASGNWTGRNVGSFTTSDIMKITVYLWLEGWDADYLIGTSVDGSKINCSLEFNLTAA